MPQLKVVSGGQTGIDQSGLFAARDCGLVTDGHAPLGWRTDAGPAPWLADFGLVEASSSDYPTRTGMNVRDSNATLILGDCNSPGCRLTLKFCEHYRKPYLCVSRPFEGHEAVAAWIATNGVTTLNVAGNRERSFPGIGAEARAFLVRVFSIPR